MSASDGWFKSTRSGGGDNCVEAKHLPDGGTAVRHSKQPDGVELVFSASMWIGLLETVQMTRFPGDLGEWGLARPGHLSGAQARHIANGAVEFTHTNAAPSEVLTFTAAEWSAFAEGVRADEFIWYPPVASIEAAAQ